MTYRQSIVRGCLIALFMLAAGPILGCDSSIPSLKNAGPSILVVAVRPDPDEAAGLLAVDFYVRDLERDPVDIRLSVWRASGKREDGVVPFEPGHGSRGLNAEPQIPGAWHRLYLDVTEIPADEEIFVEFESVDAQGAPGALTATPLFTPEGGWTLPVEAQGSP